MTFNFVTWKSSSCLSSGAHWDFPYVFGNVLCTVSKLHIQSFCIPVCKSPGTTTLGVCLHSNQKKSDTYAAFPTAAECF